VSSPIDHDQPQPTSWIHPTDGESVAVAENTRGVEGALYHSPLTHARGDQLLPLNLMPDTYPDLYQRHYAKYAGHEETVQRPVPPLSCTWGDVVFFSPVDSTRLFEPPCIPRISNPLRLV